MQILNKYGNPIVTGSYVLKLMTWRDLDIHLEDNEMTVEKFWKLGKEILLKLKPHKIHFRSDTILKPDLPSNFYWGIYTTLRFPDVWKIDIHSVTSEQLVVLEKRFDELKSNITKNRKKVILEIKSHFCKHPEYRKKFSSMDIYNAVIEKDIKSIKEFSEWLKKNKGILL